MWSQVSPRTPGARRPLPVSGHGSLPPARQVPPFGRHRALQRPVPTLSLHRPRPQGPRHIGAPLPCCGCPTPRFCPLPGGPSTEQDVDTLDPGRPAARGPASPRLQGSVGQTRGPAPWDPLARGTLRGTPAPGRWDRPARLAESQRNVLAPEPRPCGWRGSAGCGRAGSAAGGRPPRDPEHGVYTGRPRELAAPTPGSTSAPHAGWGCTQPPAQHGPRKGPQTHLGFHQNADDISHETVTAPGCDREAPKSTPARRRHRALPLGTGPLAPSLPGRHVPTGREEGRAGAAPGPGWRRRGPGAHGETRGGEQGPGLASANARWFPRKEDLAVRFLTALRVSDGARPPRRHLPPHSQCPEAHARAQNRLRLEAHES